MAGCGRHQAGCCHRFHSLHGDEFAVHESLAVDGFGICFELKAISTRKLEFLSLANSQLARAPERDVADFRGGIDDNAFVGDEDQACRSHL